MMARRARGRRFLMRERAVMRIPVGMTVAAVTPSPAIRMTTPRGTALRESRVARLLTIPQLTPLQVHNHTLRTTMSTKDHHKRQLQHPESPEHPIRQLMTRCMAHIPGK